MKWVALLLFIAIVPALAAWLRGNAQRRPIVWTILGLLPFVMDPLHLSVAPIAWPMWPGYVKGMEVSLLDAVALAVLLSSSNVRIRSPMLIVLPVYILLVLISMVNSGVPEAAFFYAWQLARILLLFVAIVKICNDERGPSALILGMILGLCVQAGYSIEQRLTGVTQSSGTFGHQNLLGMVSHFVTFPALALLMVNAKMRAPLFGVLAGAIVVILGASRATLGLAAVGFVSLLLMSILLKPTGRKSMIVGLGLLALLAATPVALSSLQKRFETAPLSTDYDERAAFARAARMAIADHPMGVGSNQYVVAANIQGYSDRAGVVWNSGSRSANVHNTYLLVWAETGFMGLVAFITLMLMPIMIALRGAWRNRKDPRSDLTLGLGIGLAVVSVHSLYEWVFVDYVVQVLFAIDAGIITGLVRQMSVAKSNRQKSGRLVDTSKKLITAHETV